MSVPNSPVGRAGCDIRQQLRPKEQKDSVFSTADIAIWPHNSHKGARSVSRMAKIAFILLCHKDPEGVIAQARRLTAVGDFMAIHFDARANPADYARIRAA